MRELASIWVRLLCPVIPFTAEKLWTEMGNDGLCSFAPWPISDESAIDVQSENAEELLMRTVEDLESILRIISLKPRNITIAVAPEWKWEIFSKVHHSSAQGTGNIIKELMQDAAVRERGETAVNAIKECSALIHRLSPELAANLATTPPHEMEAFQNAKAFLEHEFSVSVTIVQAEEFSHEKAKNATPFKPALIIE
jgi:leucyl-tRNA synthetase